MHCPVTLDAGCHGRAYRRIFCAAGTRAPTTLCYLRCTTAMGLGVAPRGLGGQAGNGRPQRVIGTHTHDRRRPSACGGLEYRMKVAEPEPGRILRSPARSEPGDALLVLICTARDGVGGG